MASWLTQLRVRRRAGADPFTARYTAVCLVAAATLALVVLALTQRRRAAWEDDGVPARGAPTKVLLLSSNGRSGSSYLSELLTPATSFSSSSSSSSPSAVRFFEPLRWLEDPPELTREELRSASSPVSSWRRSSSPSQSEKLRMLESLLECRLGEYEDVLLSGQSRERVFGRSFSAAPVEDGIGAPPLPGLLGEYEAACSNSSLRYPI